MSTTRIEEQSTHLQLVGGADPQKQYTSNNMFDFLPVELLPRILLNLDYFSLHSLFRAFPSICHQCVLIVEDFDSSNYADPTLFTDFPDLIKVSVREYNPSRHPAHVKIYMAAYTMQRHLKSRVTFTKASIEARFPHLHKNDSIVLYFTPNTRFSQADTYSKVLAAQQEFSRALIQESIVFHVIPLTPRETVVSSLSKGVNSLLSHSPRDCYSLDYIAVIRLEGLERLDGIRFNEQVKSITIVFHKSCKRPTISRLMFASSALDLSIYYENRLPLIKYIGFTEDNHNKYAYISNTLILGHVPSLAGHLSTALPVHPDEYRDISYISALTPRNSPSFGNISVIGGPNSIIDYLDTSKVLTLEWKQTCRSFGYACSSAINASFMVDFKFETLLKSARCPRLSNTYKDFAGINIIGHNGLDISPLVPFPDSLRFVCIYVESPDPTDHVSSLAEIRPCLLKREREKFAMLKIEGLQFEKCYSTPGRLERAINKRIQTVPRL